VLPRTTLLGAACAGLLSLSACASTHLARPVGRGNTRVNVSLAGPFVELKNLPIPVPLSTVGVAHGMSDAVDVHADVHPTALLFNPGEDYRHGNATVPVLGYDLGFAWHPLERHRTALTVGGAGYAFANRQDAVLFTDWWVATGIFATRWLWLSAGVHNLVRVAASDRELRERAWWTPNAFLGVALIPGRVQIDLEARWYGITQNGFRAAPDWFPLGELGALGFALGFNYQFDGRQQ
jgi:hypothetical protein